MDSDDLASMPQEETEEGTTIKRTICNPKQVSGNERGLCVVNYCTAERCSLGEISWMEHSPRVLNQNCKIGPSNKSGSFNKRNPNYPELADEKMMCVFDSMF